MDIYKVYETDEDYLIYYMNDCDELEDVNYSNLVFEKVKKTPEIKTFFDQYMIKVKKLYTKFPVERVSY